MGKEEEEVELAAVKKQKLSVLSEQYKEDKLLKSSSSSPQTAGGVVKNHSDIEYEVFLEGDPIISTPVESKNKIHCSYCRPKRTTKRVKEN